MSVEINSERMASVLERMPWATWVMTSAYDGNRSGMVVRWVQRCAYEPLLISVAVRKCHSLEPLIRDSRGFAINLIDESDRLLLKKFDTFAAPDEASDPFDVIGVDTWATGSPIIKRAKVAFDCEVIRHLDLEADCELFIGQVHDARIVTPGG